MFGSGRIFNLGGITMFGGNYIQKFVALILFIVSFFVAGDMSKANIAPENTVTESSTRAEFVFENKTGYRLNIEVKVESIEREAAEFGKGQWVKVPFRQYFNEGIDYYKLYPTEKTTLHVEFVNNKGEAISLAAGTYRITVSYVTTGYTSEKTGSATCTFNVAADEVPSVS